MTLVFSILSLVAVFNSVDFHIGLSCPLAFWSSSTFISDPPLSYTTLPKYKNFYRTIPSTITSTSFAELKTITLVFCWLICIVRTHLYPCLSQVWQLSSNIHEPICKETDVIRIIHILQYFLNPTADLFSVSPLPP